MRLGPPLSPLLLILVVACVPEVRVIQVRPTIIRLASGDSVLFVATGPIFDPNGDTGLMYEYHPYISLDDPARLRPQVLELWETVRPKAESLRAPFVVLRATTRFTEPTRTPTCHHPELRIRLAETHGRAMVLSLRFHTDPAQVREPPNKRLKLTGGDRSKGTGVLCPGGHELSFNDGCAPRARRAQLKRDPLGDALRDIAGVVRKLGSASERHE